MIPTGRFVLLMVAPLVVAALTMVDRTLLLGMLAIDAAIALVAAADAALAYRPLVTASREAAQVFSVGRPNAVHLTVRSLSGRTLLLQANDDLFADARAAELPVHATLPPHARRTLTYHVEPHARGAYELGDVTIRYPSPLGLWRRQLRIPARSPVRIYPDLQQIRTYDLLARRDRQLALLRAIRIKGGESEFERLRDYTRDDEYRSIDWKATARRDRLIAREYQLESDQTVIFMLDAGRLMTAEVRGLCYLDHALNATLMLAHVAAKGGDRVGLVGFDDAVRRFVLPRSGPGGAQALIRAGYDLHPRLVESDFDNAFEHVAHRVRQRSLIILFTQVVDDAAAKAVVRRTRALSRRHLPLIVMFRDADIERLVEPSPRGAADLYVAGAAAEMLRWRGGILSDLKRAGAHVLDVGASELTTAIINRYLEIKARHLL